MDGIITWTVGSNVALPWGLFEEDSLGARSTGVDVEVSMHLGHQSVPLDPIPKYQCLAADPQMKLRLWSRIQHFFGSFGIPVKYKI